MSMLSTAALATLESAINTALRYDPGSRIALAKLEGQVLALESTAPPLRMFLAPHSEGVSVMGLFEGEVTTLLRGPLTSLMALTLNQSSNLAASDVEVMGETALLVNLQRIFANLDIDWEEPLSQWLGDVVGHETADAIRAAKGWVSARGQTATRLAGEYLTEELKSLPSQSELKQFYNDVDELRLAADRCAANFTFIKQAMEKKQQTHKANEQKITSSENMSVQDSTRQENINH